VTVFEAEAQVGGRLGRPGDHPIPADAGEAFFSAKQPAFRTLAASWVRDGVAGIWEARQTPPKRRLVGVPDMGALARHVAADLPVRTRSRVVRLAQRGGALFAVLASGEEQGPFDRMVLALPADATASLLGLAEAPQGSAHLSLVLGFAQAVRAPWEVCQPDSGPLSWVCRETSKPGRGPQETWVVHAARDWGAKQAATEDETVIADLCSAFAALTGDRQPPVVTSLRRSTVPSTPLACGDRLPRGVTICGRPGAQSTVEASWRAGVAAAAGIVHGLADAAAQDRNRLAAR
jgi:hypothetical protein